MNDDSSPLFDNLRKLINTIDELRDLGLQQYISLPRIAVLGTQSSGKSSLLESIVGLDFLPRGDGVVTRRPLELRLIRVHGEEGMKPWAIFDVLKGTKFTNFVDVKSKIEEMTDQVAGQKKGIIDDPIILNIYSATCPDLTIIDLPGITRIPLAGSDQPKDIERITREMASRYCKDPRTIILTVVPANADISTSDALKTAQELDPKGVRTIGVITKIDIMDRGTDAKRMLLGQDVSLRLGYVGVRNRSQQDIIDKIGVLKALESEKNFFGTHPIYSTMPGFCGTEALVNKLTKVMYNHIRTLLPEIVRELNGKILDCEDKLRDLGPALPSSAREKTQLLWNMINTFTEQFKNKLRGKYDAKHQVKNSDKERDKEMSAGAQVKVMFNKLYEKYVDPNYRATKDYTDKDINKAIVLHEGDSIPGFPSIDAFLALILPKLEELKEPADTLLGEIFAFLDSIACQLINKNFQRFPTIINEITEIVSKVLSQERDKARSIVDSLVEAETGYLFTNDFDYLTHRTSMMVKAGEGPDKKPIDPEKAFLGEMRNRIDAYFAIVVRNLRDAIPKAIGHFLVKNAQENLQFALFEEINKNHEIMESIGEPAHITREREATSKMHEVLQRALRLLKKDPDLAAPLKLSDEDDGKIEQKNGDKAPKKGGIFG